MAVNRLLIIEITLLVILAVVDAYPAFDNNEYKHNNKDKGRTTRGLKNMDLSTARGFGKRADHYAMNLLPLDVYADNKYNSFNQDVQMNDSLETMFKNKYSARNDLKYLIENVLDRNHDGYISVREWMQAMQLNDGES